MVLFDDDDPEVRRHAAGSVRHLDDLDSADIENLVRCFRNSKSFGERPM